MNGADRTMPKLVKRKAARSSFYAAMRLMPQAERDAMFAVYAFCRRVDDIADDGIGTRAERKQRLAGWRADIEALYAGAAPGQAGFLGPAMRRFGLRKADFLTVIDGMDMDVTEDIVAPDLAALDLYCERVASAVGRLSIRIFGMDEEPGFALAHHLGRALQLTNILRDLDEDAGLGRLYLPREFLQDAGIRSLDPRMVVADPAVDGPCRRLAALAHEHYAASGRILAARPKGFIRTPRLMAAVYSEILRRSEAAGFASPRRRVSLGKATLLGFVVRYGYFG